MTHRPLILIVEDDDVTAECLEDLLSAEGYATQIMHTPRAVETVRGVQPDLVLLDLIFPDSRGEELLHALRREGDLANVPVVLLSAVPHLAERAARLPVQGHVSKPFELDVLLRTVGELAGGPCRAQGDLRWAPARGTGC